VVMPQNSASINAENQSAAIAFAASVAVYDRALVPNLFTNNSCVAAGWALTA
jgi:hypothetical protein